MRHRALFVDDDPELLAGLLARARRFRDSWEVAGANGAESAMRALEDPSFDLVVTDLAMPGGGGGAVLAEARTRSPATLRFVLSGRVDKKLSRDAALAHQVFTKPGAIAEILSRAELALAARGDMTGPEIELVTSGAAIPQSPKVFAALKGALADEDYEPRSVAKIVEQDFALTGRVLNLASSSALGPRRKVTSVRSAVVALGKVALEHLVLFEECLPASTTLHALHRDHALRIAAIAGQLEPGRDGLFMAAVLHDLGRLVIDEPDDDQGRHAQLGSYLAALWGFSPEIASAVHDHHHPPAQSTPGLADIVHAAEWIASARRSSDLAGLGEAFGPELAARWQRVGSSALTPEPRRTTSSLASMRRAGE